MLSHIVAVTRPRFPDRFGVVVIAFAFREQEQLFVRFCWTVSDGLGHGVRLRPYNLGTQIPAWLNNRWRFNTPVGNIYLALLVKVRQHFRETLALLPNLKTFARFTEPFCVGHKLQKGIGDNCLPLLHYQIGIDFSQKLAFVLAAMDQPAICRESAQMP